jgi:YYY domain-containing protein
MPERRSKTWIYDLLLVGVLLAAVALRLTGLNWDEGQQLHPDERFLDQVVAAIHPVQSIGEYFDTATSPLNPNNLGFSFFVYGTLPLFIVRYVAEWVHMSGYGEVFIVGRALSAIADLGVIYLVYLIAARLFDKRAGLLAAAFSALSVMQVQQSHFWTVDNFVNFFTALCVYFAVRVAAPAAGSDPNRFNTWDFVGFGFALGCALASKVSVFFVAGTLPLAVLIRWAAMPAGKREAQFGAGVLWTAVAAGVSLLAFRLFQPYAFSGFGLNPLWVDTMRQLSGQVNGDADWPPSMQWARRPLWFGLENMVRWGLGWPLALVGWGGFLWMGWRLFKEDFLKPPAVLWGWGLIYFAWQSLAFNPTMRYFLPVYPVLAVFGGWALVALWDLGARRARAARWHAYLRPAALALGAVALVGSAAWAVAFVQIYRQPVSRVAAARWIYANVPGPITLDFSTQDGEAHQPISTPYDYTIRPDAPLFVTFTAHEQGLVERIDLKTLLAPVHVAVRAGENKDILTANFDTVVDLGALTPGETQELHIQIGGNSFADLSTPYDLQVDLPPGSGRLVIESAELRNSQSAEIPAQQISAGEQQIELGQSLVYNFVLDGSTVPDELVLRVRPQTVLVMAPLDLRIQVSANPDLSSPLTDEQVQVRPGTNPAQAGLAASLQLGTQFQLDEDSTYFLQISVLSPASVQLAGSAVANETSWDDGLPLRVDGYDGFGGIYQGDLNFEIYWDENDTKVERFQTVLDRSEYIFITSSRQWGSLPRIPERFPLAVVYYRALLGCPDEQTIAWCYIHAQPGSFQGQLGFELVRVFENAPRLGGLKLNDQAAEEAFTVYDHPKVFIFQKTEEYDSAHVAEVLATAPVDQAVHVTPKQASGRIPPTLMLPADRLQQQQAGGTWSELFSRDSWVNASPWVSLVVWYVALAALGLLVYPLVRLALPGLRDGGYPFARLAALLLLAYLAWMGGSLGLSFSRGWLLAFVALLALLSALAARAQWPALREEWETKRAQFLRVELLFLGFFLLMLLIRLGNPDLWHPGKGGEKPMDFAYLNAILKSTSFPPYDPWFAGGYINYYYYGFVLVGSLIKLLGIVPAVAYNLVLPTLFAMVALGAYSLAWNVWSAWRAGGRERGRGLSAEAVGLAAAIAILLFGNLGNFQMLFQGYARLGAAGAAMDTAGFFTQLGWTLRGMIMSVSGQSLPFGLGDWYWNPTRIFPAPNESAPITEFPLFTFTYADLHAHMIALPVTLLSLGWALSAVLSRAWERGRGWLQLGWVFLFGAIVIGSLRPINTWDLPTYALLAALAAGYAIWRYARSSKRSPLLWTLIAAGGLGLLSILAYSPFADWYRQGYSSVRIWDGAHVSFGPYFVHWGIFLFFILAWMVWETREWLASTPLSSVRKLEPYVWLLPVAFLLVFGVMVVLHWLGVMVGWLLVPLLIWAGLLLLRPGQDELKRLTLFMIGTGLFLTLLVEIIVLQGDISRMNTVFKFYMQAWTLLAISAALAAAWCWQALRAWAPGWRAAWQLAGAALVTCAGLFLLLGVTAKMRDRMVAEAPHTLDGMAYMEYAQYFERDQTLQLREDYETIRWMQDNIQGSPVILEGYVSEYRWGARYSIYTGLPTVLGWNFHQRQQREFVPGNDVWARVADVDLFYQSPDPEAALSVIQKYNVKYIIVGQMERALYPGLGLEKFEAQDGLLWREVFRVGDTVVYEVLPQAVSLQ